MGDDFGAGFLIAFIAFIALFGAFLVGVAFSEWHVHRDIRRYGCPAYVEAFGLPAPTTPDGGAP